MAHERWGVMHTGRHGVRLTHMGLGTHGAAWGHRYVHPWCLHYPLWRVRGRVSHAGLRGVPMHRMQWGHPWFVCHLWVGWPPFAQSLCAHMRAGRRGGGGFPCGPHLHTSTCKQREGATRQQGACGSPSTGHPVSCTQGGDGVEMGVVLSLQPIHWAGRGQKGGSTISYMAVPPPPPPCPLPFVGSAHVQEQRQGCRGVVPCTRVSVPSWGPKETPIRARTGAGPTGEWQQGGGPVLALLLTEWGQGGCQCECAWVGAMQQEGEGAGRGCVLPLFPTCLPYMETCCLCVIFLCFHLF
jgi:hypothetical protein